MHHKDKIALARRLLTRAERRANTPIWDSFGWYRRAQARFDAIKAIHEKGAVKKTFAESLEI
jgi:hypothetical protein